VLKLPLSIQINALPTVLSFLRARSTPWQRWLGNSMLGVWIGQQIPSSVMQIDANEMQDFIINQNQHVVVLATSTPTSAPPNICTILFRPNRDFISSFSLFQSLIFRPSVGFSVQFDFPIRSLQFRYTINYYEDYLLKKPLIFLLFS
jgi:hypothetical protein